eukprot:350229-Chlamydomonas_euryale.AAC.1
MASSASLCRRYRPPVLDTRMVTSGPEKWRSATALTPPPAAATASATSGDAHASMSSKSADSAGGVRPQPTVMRNAALLLGAAASQKSASGSATSTTWTRAPNKGLGWLYSAFGWLVLKGHIPMLSWDDGDWIE